MSESQQFCPPRPDFRPAGRVSKVRLELTNPPFAKNVWRKGAKGAGLRYERKVQEMLLQRFPNYVPAPWFTYITEGNPNRQYCQPDGLIFDFHRGLITLIEIKLKHTSDAWWQLRHLYIPIVSSLFGDKLWQYAPVEIVRWYDVDTKFPEKIRMLDSVSKIQPGQFGLHIWRTN